LKVPLIRVGFPIHDRIGGQRVLHLGYRGAQELFDRIINALLEVKQETSTHRLQLPMNAAARPRSRRLISKTIRASTRMRTRKLWPRASAGRAALQHPVQFLQPQIRLHEREPPRRHQHGADAAAGHRVSARRGGEAARKFPSWALPGRATRLPIPRKRWKRCGSRGNFPKMILCVATNGLNVAPYVDEMADLKVSHVTLTINAIDPVIGGEIYAWVRDGKRPLRGEEAAAVLSARQIDALVKLKARGITSRSTPSSCRA
jgi:hypothetical protein